MQCFLNFPVVHSLLHPSYCHLTTSEPIDQFQPHLLELPTSTVKSGGWEKDRDAQHFASPRLKQQLEPTKVCFA